MPFNAFMINTEMAALALGPQPENWAEPTVHVHTPEVLGSVLSTP